jgi:BirA family biotin operon repressor/biotin-[acetyl-CoA-carboxylase] ligase
LAFSIIITPKKRKNQSDLSRMTGLGAIAVCEGLERGYNLHAKIKWPNDVLLDRKKVSGILAEGHWMGEELQTVILGIGINVASESMPAEELLDFPASCVENHLDRPVDRITLLKVILTQLLKWKDLVWESEFVDIWQKHLAFVGERVQISAKDQIMQIGKIIGLDRNGRLILRSQKGEEIILQAGEIHLRPLIDRREK